MCQSTIGPINDYDSKSKHQYSQCRIGDETYLKAVPKYCTTVIVKNAMEDWLPITDPNSPTYHIDNLWRSAYKSSMAGMAGAVLTNPLDVVRNEMFQTNQSLYHATKSLYQTIGMKFFIRGMDKNIIAVAIPLACTVFFTDALIQFHDHSTKRS
jgi:Mitochondrial carrier protein